MRPNFLDGFRRAAVVGEQNVANGLVFGWLVGESPSNHVVPTPSCPRYVSRLRIQTMYPNYVSKLRIQASIQATYPSYVSKRCFQIFVNTAGPQLWRLLLIDLIYQPTNKKIHYSIIIQQKLSDCISSHPPNSLSLAPQIHQQANRNQSTTSSESEEIFPRIIYCHIVFSTRKCFFSMPSLHQ